MGKQTLDGVAKKEHNWIESSVVYRSGWPQIHGNLPASAFGVLELQMCATIQGTELIFQKLFFFFYWQFKEKKIAKLSSRLEYSWVRAYHASGRQLTHPPGLLLPPCAPPAFSSTSLMVGSWVFATQWWDLEVVVDGSFVLQFSVPYSRRARWWS